MKNSNNDHLDTLEGRYYLQLERRALTRALQAATEAARVEAVKDAILFRAARYVFSPNAPVQERALELNEGLAEYTGVKVGNPTPEEQIKAALRDLINLNIMYKVLSLLSEVLERAGLRRIELEISLFDLSAIHPSK